MNGMHRITESILPGDLVFDIGAHIGVKTEWFLRRLAHVVAVEPQPAILQLLRARHGSNPQVTIVPKAVGAAVGSLPMSVNRTSTTISTLSDEWKKGRFSGERWDESIEVAVTTLDELVYLYGPPRLAKIDVEGYEKQVIQGLSRKIGCLSFEFTIEYVRNAADICQRLVTLGYRHFNVSLKENEDFVASEWTSDFASMLSFLKERGHVDRDLWGDIYAA